jgi:hypothetical protein
MTCLSVDAGRAMPATTYGNWGGPVGQGMAGAMRIGVAGIAKPALKDHPMALVNEIICGDLGRGIRLPIPPGVIVNDPNKVKHHVSLDFGLAGQTLPPADPQKVAKEQPAMACGVILFDLWIANCDRHESNLAYDESQKSLQLFDHERALLCGMNGRRRLESLDDEDIIDSHCLTPEISDMVGFDHWNNRIKTLSKFYIEETVGDAMKLGLTSDDAEFVTKFLLRRRSRLMSLIKKYRKLFINADWTLSGPGGPP